MPHGSHNALDRYPTVQYFEHCAHVHISVTNCCVVGYITDALWDVCNRSIIWLRRCLARPNCVRPPAGKKQWGMSPATWHTLPVLPCNRPTCSFLAVAMSPLSKASLTLVRMCPQNEDITLASSPRARPSKKSCIDKNRDIDDFV